VLEDEELLAVALESARTIDIDCFVLADTIGWIWVRHAALPEGGSLSESPAKGRPKRFGGPF
jgi:hypothetical protein